MCALATGAPTACRMPYLSASALCLQAPDYFATSLIARCGLPSLRSGSHRARRPCNSRTPLRLSQGLHCARAYGLPSGSQSNQRHNMCTKRGGLPCPPRTPPAAYGLAAFPRARSASSRLPAAECAACIGGGVVSFVGRGRVGRHGLRVRPGSARLALKAHARLRSQKRCAPVPAAPAHSLSVGYALCYARSLCLPAGRGFLAIYGAHNRPL